MTGWVFETLLWTAVLIAFVLMVRRPVARMFGPQIAYALWALPALRLALPPIELPAWMRPVESAPTALPDPVNLISAPGLPAARSDSVMGVEAAATDAATSLTPVSSFDIGLALDLAFAAWLIGAAIFLALRFSAYFRLRDELLAQAREVGRSGKVRLVETPGTRSPLAFGVIDKVVALPEGFLAQPDRRARDLALAHELAHHKGRDLLVNVLIQPLFAIHWWNPLGRYGWLALRRDQEAACDARVMAAAPREEREAYATLIVRFAAAPNIVPNHALTAPMACPVLGEKSIIHRLRSLKMDNTTRNRRMAGRLMVGAAVLALPMTATISYAAGDAPEPPAPPAVASFGLAPPALPAPPEAPEPPLPPEAPMVDEDVIIEIDPDVEVSRSEERGKSVYIFSGRDESDKDVRIVMRDGDRPSRWVQRFEHRGDGPLTDAQINEILEGVRKSLEEANRELEDLPKVIEQAMKEADESRLRASQVRVEMKCDPDSDEPATKFESDDGATIIRLCQARVMDHALKGLREARREIETSRNMGLREQRRALREMDRVIDRWEDATK